MTNKFKNRSNKAELMDMPIRNKVDLFKNLAELERINKLTGGPTHTFLALQELLKNHTGTIHLVEVGYGAGDLLVYLLKHQHRLNCKIKITAIDSMPLAYEYASSTYPYLKEHITFETMDYKQWFESREQVDVVVAGLFCHHLSDEELVGFFGLVNRSVKIGMVINDLERSPVAYYGIKIPTFLFAQSSFTKNDAPLSVLRGFKRKELMLLFKKAGVSNFTIKWKWAYRFLITLIPNDNNA